MILSKGQLGAAAGFVGSALVISWFSREAALLFIGAVVLVALATHYGKAQSIAGGTL